MTRTYLHINGTENSQEPTNVNGMWTEWTENASVIAIICEEINRASVSEQTNKRASKHNETV